MITVYEAYAMSMAPATLRRKMEREEAENRQLKAARDAQAKLPGHLQHIEETIRSNAAQGYMFCNVSYLMDKDADVNLLLLDSTITQLNALGYHLVHRTDNAGNIMLTIDWSSIIPSSR